MGLCDDAEVVREWFCAAVPKGKNCVEREMQIERRRDGFELSVTKTKNSVVDRTVASPSLTGASLLPSPASRDTCCLVDAKDDRVCVEMSDVATTTNEPSNSKPGGRDGRYERVVSDRGR